MRPFAPCFGKLLISLLSDLSIGVSTSEFDQHLMMVFDDGHALFEISQTFSDARLIRRIGSADASRNLADAHEELIPLTRQVN